MDPSEAILGSSLGRGTSLRFRKSTSGGQGPKTDNADGGDAGEPSPGGSDGPHLTLHASARLIMRAAAAKQRLRGSGGNAAELQLPSRGNAVEVQAPASSQPAPTLGELRMSSQRLSTSKSRRFDSMFSGSRRLDSRESSGGSDDDNPTHPLPPLPLLSRSMSIDASKPFFDQVNAAVVKSELMSRPTMDAQDASGLLRRWLLRDLPRKYFGSYPMQVVNLVCIVLSFILYVVECYSPINLGEHDIYVVVMVFLEYSLSMLFTVDLVFTMLLSTSPWGYLFSLWGLMEVLSILPGFLSIAGLTYLSFTRILRLTKVVRIMRLHHVRTDVALDDQEDATAVEVAAVIRNMALTILLMTGIVFAAATASKVPLYSRGELQWHDALYYVVVTISTVGYGDIAPTQPFSRLLAVIIIICAFTIIPYAVGQLIDTFRRREVEQYFQTVRVQKGQSHVVVCGTVTERGLHRFLKQLFHPNHRNTRSMIVVILNPDPPKGRMHGLLFHSRYRSRLHYIAGSPHFTQDLRRAQLTSAKAVFILSQVMGNEEHSVQEDSLILYDMAIRQHLIHERSLGRLTGRGPQVLLQVNTTDAKEKVLLEERLVPTQNRLRATSRVDDESSTPGSPRGTVRGHYVVSRLEIKMAILAHASVLRGFLALFLHTLRFPGALPKNSGGHRHWLEAYRSGAAYNIYSVRVELGRHVDLTGKTFHELASALYSANKMVALGFKEDNHIRINPGPDYRFGRSSSLVLFVLAKSQSGLDRALKDLDVALRTPKTRRGAPRRDYQHLSRMAVDFKPTHPPSAHAHTHRPRPHEKGNEATRHHVAEASRCVASATRTDHPEGLQSGIKRGRDVEHLLGDTGVEWSRGLRALDRAIECESVVGPTDVKGMSGHVVICLCSSSTSPASSYLWLEHLLIPLRRLISAPILLIGHNKGAFLELLHALHAPSSRSRSAHSPSEQRSSDSDRMQVNDIFFFDGHTNSLADLRTVQVTEASRVMVLSAVNGAENGSPEDAEGFALGDREVLLCMAALEVLLPGDLYDRVFVVTDLEHEGNCKHLRHECQPNAFWGSSPFVLQAAQPQQIQMGQLFRPPALGQLGEGYAASFHPFVGQANAPVSEDLYDWPLLAAGRVCPQGGLDILLVRMFYHPAEIEFWRSLLNMQRSRKDPPSSRLYPTPSQGYLDQLSLPPELRGRLYEDVVVDLLCNDGVLVLGLYRPMGCLSSPLPYVHVCPDPHTVLEGDDLLFVIMPPRLASQGPDSEEGEGKRGLMRPTSKSTSSARSGSLPPPPIAAPSLAHETGGAAVPSSDATRASSPSFPSNPRHDLQPGSLPPPPSSLQSPTRRGGARRASAGDDAV